MRYKEKITVNGLKMRWIGFSMTSSVIQLSKISADRDLKGGGPDAIAING